MSGYNRKVNVPENADVIDDDELKSIIIDCHDKLSKSKSFDSHSSLFYDVVLKELRKRNKFYVGLNNAIVTDLLFDIQGNVYDSPEEELDELCWKKVNKLPYNKSRLHELYLYFEGK
jgi:hypothetical protein